MKIQIGKYYLDEEQTKIVMDNSRYLLVVAGAGSGKTLTILGKIKYLIYEKNIRPEEILCISYTRAAAQSLKDKIKNEFNTDMDVYTFHKLAMRILEENNIKFDITDNETLERIINKYIYQDVLGSKKHYQAVLSFFNRKATSLKEYKNFIYKNTDLVWEYEKLIAKYIRLFKCNGYDISYFKDIIKKDRWKFWKYKKKKDFVMVVLNIYLRYQKYLEEEKELDFDDLIVRACEVVKSGGVIFKYKIIIIDEYQDTSVIRFHLIREMLLRLECRYMVVGDDFQSIYRFTGCDLDLFINFKKYFLDGKILKIQNTYRNSQELIDIAGSFVMQNKRQINKELRSAKRLDKPLKIVYYKDIAAAVKKVILRNKESKYLILGRNNKDRDMILDNRNFKLVDDKVVMVGYEEIEITYMTIHKSKGLECDNVIMINLRDSIMGFPNKIEDHAYLGDVAIVNDKYPYNEERRLFYVGITRTKNYCFLMVPYSGKSVFIKELEKNYLHKVEIIKD